jgi:hypothetical protein
VEEFNHSVIIPLWRAATCLNWNCWPEQPNSLWIPVYQTTCLQGGLNIGDHVAKDITDGWAEQRNNDHDDNSDQDKN